MNANSPRTRSRSPRPTSRFKATATLSVTTKFFEMFATEFMNRVFRTRIHVVASVRFLTHVSPVAASRFPVNVTRLGECSPRSDGTPVAVLRLALDVVVEAGLEVDVDGDGVQRRRQVRGARVQHVVGPELPR